MIELINKFETIKIEKKFICLAGVFFFIKENSDENNKDKIPTPMSVPQYIL